MTKQTFWSKLKSLFSGHSKAAFEPTEKEGVWYWKNPETGTTLVGLTEFAYQDIGNITFIDFPISENQIEVDDDLVELEGDKAVENLKSPVTGEVINRNQALVDDPSRIPDQSQRDNWLMEVKEA
ncbi:glycine cleavage H-protein [Secundilactobacillus oryzae JCM 18671]|uniref:Glycine cleavage H-protein n=1 Tax=Secundilactobacillus oryzae JCM 18671 TaxID=1291743 RepID=A0A081BKQ3_9LACO|nr:glycine cleavage system protein H [Secundilactobacillus oryzae]GAK48621.1 glycine cleavage H-protein [Secundilactobacillus oryzae JCM 18671]